MLIQALSPEDAQHSPQGTDDATRTPPGSPASATEPRSPPAFTSLRPPTISPILPRSPIPGTEHFTRKIEPRSPSVFTNSGPPTISSNLPRSTSLGTEQSTRKMDNLSLLPDPVLVRPIDDDAAAFPAGLEEILARLRLIGRGIEVISRSRKQTVAAMAMPYDRLFQQILTDDLAFADDVERELIGPCPRVQDVAKAVALATECEVNEHSEASWNGRVHTYLLDLAFYNEMFRGRVGFMDCSKARIEPESLLPLDFAGLPIEWNIVDFVLYLESDDDIHNALRQLAATNPTTPAVWNHTHYPPLQCRPVAISIATTLTGRDWDTAKTQLSVWVAAQVNKLEQLVAQDGGEIMGSLYLPLVVVQGHEWYFLVATRQGSETVIWERIPLGSSQTVLGVYQITAALQYLGHWCDEVYRPWFKTYVAGIL